jgi:signal peptidase I
MAPPTKEGIKETIESILIAFILAFVFRAFVVEAFVIPTGSMAPTLLGGHMRFRCEECGYAFTVNYPSLDRGDDSLAIPDVTRPVFSMHCPNCGLKVRRDGSLPVYYGDRILVLKYLYMLQEPRRWDVVVFKSPAEQYHQYQTNYIKRLIGKPGETVMILDGDIYVSPNEAVAAGQPAWRIQTKPRTAQEALWRVVFDNDFRPINAAWRSPQWTQPWQPAGGSGWKTEGRMLSFANESGEGKLSFNKDANPGTFPFTDWLPYNETMSFGGSDMYNVEAYGQGLIPRWHVSDVKVQFSYARQSGDGLLRAALSKLDDTFVAEFSPQTARLRHRPASGEERVIGEAKLEGSGPLNVEFSNVDYRVTLRVNGRDLIQTTAQQYQPDLKKVLELHAKRDRLTRSGAEQDLIRSVFPPPRVELSAQRQACQISHLSLWRDVFYTPNSFRGRFESLEHGSPEKPIRLASSQEGKENEYFVLGDNSILSGDARGWTAPVDLRAGEDLYVESGRVPERFLLGKAFFVYWPAGYRPISDKAPGLVPNFGEMRSIH